MFDKIQTKLFEKGYSAHREIIQFVESNRSHAIPDMPDANSASVRMACDIDIQKILLDISDISERLPLDVEQEYIRALMDSSTALKKYIPGYDAFLRSMTPANYRIVKDHFEEHSSEIPLAIRIAVDLEKNGTTCFCYVLKLFRTVMNSYVAISDYREKAQTDSVATWNKRFLSFAKQQGIDNTTVKTFIPTLSKKDDDLEKALEDRFVGIIGLEEVKNFIRTQFKVRKANTLWKENGKQIDSSQTLNMIFTGNPGTGKTMMARLVGELFRDLDILSSGHFIEASQSDLIAQYVGQTTKKTTDLFLSALGGVLFIDEAYALTNEKGGYGQECIDTLVKLVDDHRGELLLILAGYPKEMADFLDSNSGLESKFPKELRIHFSDYSEEELNQIAKQMISAKGFRITDEAFGRITSQIAQRKRSSLANGGNARLVRNIIEEVIRHQSVRIVDTSCSSDDLDLIVMDDVPIHSDEQKNFDLEKELQTVVGLDPIKGYLRALNSLLAIQEERKRVGLPTHGSQTLHSVFKGNPGTGKTMMARIFAKLLYSMGYTATDIIVEVGASDLIAEYVGQTAIKTKKVIESAIGGVLFIDEAYSLSSGRANDFGIEAINTLVQYMYDYKDKLIVIIAGYSNEMDHFLEMNPGLVSRFPNILEFQDYTLDELFQIAERKYTAFSYSLDDDAKEELCRVIGVAKTSSTFGNGRYINNLFEKSLQMQAVRLMRTHGTHTIQELSQITKADIESSVEDVRNTSMNKIGFE